MTRRQSIVFITPVTPAEGGNGLAMRAGVWLEGLARAHDVRVLVAPVFGRPAPPGALVRRCASSFAVLGDVSARRSTAGVTERPLLSRGISPAAAPAVTDIAAGCAAVLVMRVYLLPLLDVLLEATRRPKLILDVDDLESSVERDSDPAGDAEQRLYLQLESHYVPCLDGVAVAAPDDRDVLERRHPDTRVACIPNAARVPPVTDGPDRIRTDLLLVGNLSYGPNVDGAEWLVHRVLPLLDNPPHVDLVGSGPTPRVRALAQHPGVRVTANVPAVAPWYAQARVALAPLLRGGGTRIKVIEALAHARPVVATPIGARGLDRRLIGGPRADAPILLGDSPRAFADGCARLLADTALAQRLGRDGRAAVEATLSITHVSGAIDALIRDILAGG